MMLPNIQYIFVLVYYYPAGRFGDDGLTCSILSMRCDQVQQSGSPVPGPAVAAVAECAARAHLTQVTALPRHLHLQVAPAHLQLNTQ